MGGDAGLEGSGELFLHGWVVTAVPLCPNVSPALCARTGYPKVTLENASPQWDLLLSARIGNISVLSEVWEGQAGFSPAGFPSAIHRMLWTSPGCALPSQHTWAWSPQVMCGSRRAWHTPAALPLSAPAPLASRQDFFLPLLQLQSNIEAQ